MKNLLLALLLFPLFTTGQIFLKSYPTSFQVGNNVLPLNALFLVRSRDTNAIGFSYALIPPSTGQQSGFNNILISPKRYSAYYTVSGPDTSVFTSASSIVAWYNTNAVDTAKELFLPAGYLNTEGFYFSPDTGNLLTTFAYNSIRSPTFDKPVISNEIIFQSSDDSTVTNGFSYALVDKIGSLVDASFAENKVYASPDGSSGALGVRPLVLNDLPDIPYSYLTGTPALSVATANGFAGGYSSGTFTVSTTVTGLLKADGTALSAAAYSDVSAVSGWPTTVSGFGITDAVKSTTTYNNPAFLNTLAGSKITGLTITSANGLAGSYSAGAFTLSTSITGLLKGNGTAISAAAYSDVAGLTGAPVFTTLTTSGTGIALSFNFTIPAGYTFSNFQSQNASIAIVTGSSVSGTTLTVTCASAPIMGTNNVIFGGFYK